MKLTVNDVEYATGKLDAFKQFHVARRLAPVLLALGGAAAGMMKVIAGAGDEEAMKAMSPMAEVLANMSDADSEYVLHTCLAVAQRQSGAGWANVFIPGAGLAFQDIDLSAMIQIAVATLRENLGNFIPAPSDSPSAGA